MVHRDRWAPGIRAVAVLAYVGRIDVIEALAILDGAVVATDAVAGDAFMAERGR